MWFFLFCFVLLFCNVFFKLGSNKEVKFCFLFTQKRRRHQLCHIGRAWNKFLTTRLWSSKSIFDSKMTK